jgi:hypothetical protein
MLPGACGSRQLERRTVGPMCRPIRPPSLPGEVRVAEAHGRSGQGPPRRHRSRNGWLGPCQDRQISDWTCPGNGETPLYRHEITSRFTAATGLLGPPWGSPCDNLDVPGSARPGQRYSSWPSSQAGTPWRHYSGDVTRIKPSWTTEATRRPSRLKTWPRASPRAPDAAGDSWRYSSQSSARNGPWNHIA